MCVLKWLHRLCFIENLLFQISHAYDFSSVCVWRCRFREHFVENALLQTLQTCGFSPVCVRRWAVRLLPFENILSQILQIWIFSCIRNWEWLSIIAYFTTEIFLFLSIRRCYFSLLFSENLCLYFSKTWVFSHENIRWLHFW